MKRRIMIALLAVLSIAMYASDVLTGSYYNPVRGQCYGNPLITADGSRINLEKLKNGTIRWVALSRDLLKKYSMGDTIEVESENPYFNGLWIIHDKMGKRNRMKIDFLLHVKDRHKPPRVIKIQRKSCR